MIPQVWRLLVPNILDATVDEVEKLYSLVDTVPSADQYVFDMHPVDFINPYGLLALVTVVRCSPGFRIITFCWKTLRCRSICTCSV
jgi:hypothetical protein